MKSLPQPATTYDEEVESDIANLRDTLTLLDQYFKPKPAAEMPVDENQVA
jgi:hypothetical protein